MLGGIPKALRLHLNELIFEWGGGMGVPDSISQLEAHGCTKVCSEIGLFPYESAFLRIGFPDFVASLQNPINDASAHVVPIIFYLWNKYFKLKLACPRGCRDLLPVLKNRSACRCPSGLHNSILIKTPWILKLAASRMFRDLAPVLKNQGACRWPSGSHNSLWIKKLMKFKIGLAPGGVNILLRSWKIEARAGAHLVHIIHCWSKSSLKF